MAAACFLVVVVSKSSYAIATSLSNTDFVDAQEIHTYNKWGHQKNETGSRESADPHCQNTNDWLRTAIQPRACGFVLPDTKAWPIFLAARGTEWKRVLLFLRCDRVSAQPRPPLCCLTVSLRLAHDVRAAASQPALFTHKAAGSDWHTHITTHTLSGIFLCFAFLSIKTQT